MQLNQAITVSILPATNTLPKRWKARARHGTIILNDDSEKPGHPEWNDYDPTTKAYHMARLFCRRAGWNTPYGGGITHDNKWVFVTSVIY